MITKKLFSPSLGLTIHRLTISSSQARRIRSGVAGENNSRTSSTPASLRAELIASRMAKKTEEPINKGGSPTMQLAFIERGEYLDRESYLGRYLRGIVGWFEDFSIRRSSGNLLGNLEGCPCY